jgi:molybdenum cofactor guanylyltransferase
MGRDKALLKIGGETMLDRIARLVRGAAGSVTLIGAPERYIAFGYTVIPDRIADRGPLSGVATALSVTESDWNLIVACDMPGLTADLLADLFGAAESSDADAVVPKSVVSKSVVSKSHWDLDPLCAVYHRRCAAQALSALEHNILKMHDFLSTLRLHLLPVADPRALKNVNTPEEWLTR